VAVVVIVAVVIVMAATVVAVAARTKPSSKPFVHSLLEMFLALSLAP
jgi:hypothetical protein